MGTSVMKRLMAAIAPEQDRELARRPAPGVDELAIHGFIAEKGAIRIGRLVRQICDPRGAWLATSPLDDPAALGDAAIRAPDEAARVGRALVDAGYFGPFGVDAYLYRDARGQTSLQPRSEINARFSMGYAVGMPDDER